MKNIIEEYVVGKKLPYVAIFESRDEYICESNQSIYGRKMLFWTFAKTPGACKARFTKQKLDAVNLRIYELQDEINLDGSPNKYFAEIYPVNRKNTGSRLSYEVLEELLEDNFNQQIK